MPGKKTLEEIRASNRERQRRYKERHGWVAKVRVRESMRALRGRRRYGQEECRRCGFNAVAKILEVHHVDGDCGNNVPENLMLLCPNCHRLEHVNNKRPLRDNVIPVYGKTHEGPVEGVDVAYEELAHQNRRAANEPGIVRWNTERSIEVSEGEAERTREALERLEVLKERKARGGLNAGVEVELEF